MRIHYSLTLISRRLSHLIIATTMTLSANTVVLAEPGSAPAPEAAQQGGIVTVQSSNLGTSVTLGGVVVAYKQVTLTAQIAGRVEFIAGTEGDTFEADKILVAIDDDDLLAKRRAAIAQISNAESQINNAQMQYSREMISPQKRSNYNNPGMGMPSMFDQVFTQPFSGMMPGNAGGTPWLDRQADLHDYGNRLNQARNQHVSARSQLDEIDAKLRDARSFAPFKGVIVHKMVEVGDTVNPGQELLEFSDLTYLQIKADIPSRLMPGLSKGMMVPARLDVGSNQISARVAQIFPTADAQRHTVTVKFDLLDDVQGGPGMYAEVMIPDVTMPKSDIPTIPDSAVLWRGSLPAVFVVGSDNQPKLRLVRLGDYVNANQVSVLSGLKIGENIYAVPPANIARGWASSSQEK